MKKFVFLVLVIGLIFGVSEFSKSQGQFPYNFTCGTNYLLTAPSIRSLSTTFEGYIKPNRTDTINGTYTSYYAYFPVLVVFVQFKDDPSTEVWPNVSDTSGPTYKNTMIATMKSYNSNWWEAYNQNTETLSDYYLQSSRGRMHVIGDVYSIVLDSNASYYGQIGIGAMNHEIWKKLNMFYSIDWPKYDKWGWDNANSTFKYEKDSVVDFIYKIHKTTGNGVLPEYYGYGNLGGGADYEVDAINKIKIDHGYSHRGSGITAQKIQKKDDVFGTVCHEHAHFIYSTCHQTYGKLMYGVGFDLFNSPYEMIYNGYMTPRDAEFRETNILGDYSSRCSGSGEIIKVPITETECFLLANRRKVSHWDRLMLGDTAFYDSYNNWDYGKGLYIYHVFNGISHPPYGQVYCEPQDLESADGYYRWDTIGKQTVYMNCWTSDPTWWVFKKAEVLYTNDPSALGTNYFKGDYLSLHHFLFWNPDFSPAGMTIKFSVGKKAVDNCHLGTDRLYTNENEYFSNYNHMGTRWDAWNVGYNEVFSPYSSPSTAKYDNSNSGIFIRYKSLNTSTNEASIDVYKVGSPYTESQILQLTPPSRPMGLKADSCVYINNNNRPYLTWVHNMEPDMERDDGENIYKRYKILRTVSNDYNTIPSESNYSCIATVDILAGELPHYIDTSLISGCYMPDEAPCPPFCWIPYFIRYRVQAVDLYDSVSVKSDFASTLGLRLENGGQYGGQDDNDGPSKPINHQNVIPKSFYLNQNFPNPFNPITNIKFDLPKDIFVTVKIYDILGREVKTLVNEFKQAGSYIVSFNGSELASGVYFYRIQAGSFVQVKRMILIK